MQMQVQFQWKHWNCFRIGYNRAARIIDEIEDMGIIGPQEGSSPRQLLITEEEYMMGSMGESEVFEEPAEAYEPEPEPVVEDEPDALMETEPEPEYESEPEPAVEEKPEMAPEDDGLSSAKLSNTQAMDSFNSLPESVRRMVMDADSNDDY